MSFWVTYYVSCCTYVSKGGHKSLGDLYQSSKNKHYASYCTYVLKGGHKSLGDLSCIYVLKTKKNKQNKVTSLYLTTGNKWIYRVCQVIETTVFGQDIIFLYNQNKSLIISIQVCWQKVDTFIVKWQEVELFYNLKFVFLSSNILKV